jgi:hypothetical protein
MLINCGKKSKREKKNIKFVGFEIEKRNFVCFERISSRADII